VCGKCNNYFSTEVERVALESFPFKMIRAMFGIETKKGKLSPIIQDLWEISGDADGHFRIRSTSPEIAAKIEAGEIKRFGVVYTFEPEHPTAVCRLLLKMGLEWFTLHDPKRAYLKVYDDAKAFARRPARGSVWRFSIDIEMPVWERALRDGLDDQMIEHNGMTVLGRPSDDFFVMSFAGITLLVPFPKAYALGGPAKDTRGHVYEVKI
jgi:hypothetical protein